MAKYILLAQAQGHIHEIRNYTVENCGREQAKSYLQGMNDVFHFLAVNPDAGRSCDVELKPGNQVRGRSLTERPTFHATAHTVRYTAVSLHYFILVIPVKTAPTKEIAASVRPAAK